MCSPRGMFFSFISGEAFFFSHGLRKQHLGGAWSQEGGIRLVNSILKEVRFFASAHSWFFSLPLRKMGPTKSAVKVPGDTGVNVTCAQTSVTARRQNLSLLTDSCCVSPGMVMLTENLAERQQLLVVVLMVSSIKWPSPLHLSLVSYTHVFDENWIWSPLKKHVPFIYCI